MEIKTGKETKINKKELKQKKRITWKQICRSHPRVLFSGGVRPVAHPI